MTDTPHIRFHERLARREPLLGTLLMLPSPEIAELLGGAGFEWLFIDMEHGLLDFASVQHMVQAVASACACIVRVPSNEPILIGQALDTGAEGIIVPHVGSAAEARAAVRAAKYPPMGARSIGVGRAQGYGGRLREAIIHDNDDTVVIVQVEHVDAVPEIHEIVDVRGVSAVFIGPFDLSASLGKLGDIGAPDVRQAMRAIMSACAARSLPCGLYVGDGNAARHAFDEGYSLVCAAADTALLGDAAARLRAAAAPGGSGTRG